jgi:hypothetical protein
MSAKRTVEVWDRCTTPGCGRVLHSLREAQAGQCSSCWVKALSPEGRKSMNRLIASAFNGAGEAEKSEAVKDALKRFGK